MKLDKELKDAHTAAWYSAANSYKSTIYYAASDSAKYSAWKSARCSAWYSELIDKHKLKIILEVLNETRQRA